MFWSKQKKQTKIQAKDERINEFQELYEKYKQGIKDVNSIHRMVQLGYSLTYDMPRDAINLFVDGYNFYFKRVDGSVFSAEDVLEGKANISEANLVETEKWLHE